MRFTRQGVSITDLALNASILGGARRRVRGRSASAVGFWLKRGKHPLVETGETSLDGCDLTSEGVGMRFYTRFFLSAAVVWAIGNFSITSAQNLSEQDQKFLQNAARGGNMEVHMGELGLERGSSPAVKSFSQHLVNDHTAAN